MKNILGNNLTMTLFGESHGDAVGVVLDGLSPGMKVSDEEIRHVLFLRRPSGQASTARREEDEYQILSGVYNARTTGTPLCISIPNKNARSGDYYENRYLARPGHADYTAFCKYHGYEDFRGGGHFSGRVTAGIVAAGGILIPALKEKGIYIGTHISLLGGVADREFGDYETDAKELYKKQFPVLSKDAEALMMEKILEAKDDCDSIGGILTTVICGLPAGLGEPWFDSMESRLSSAMFAIGGVKGIEFGSGFGFASVRGSEANDSFRVRAGKVVTETNNNAGINGGITNGMPILFNLAIKPTPSIYKKQRTVDFGTNSNVEIELSGRHDPCIAHRARAVVDALCAFTVADLLIGRFGTDYFTPTATF